MYIQKLDSDGEQDACPCVIVYSTDCMRDFRTLG